MTASRVASSSLLNSLHVMVSALGGAGTTGTSVFLGKPGIGGSGMGMPGNPGTVVGVFVVDVIGGPGWGLFVGCGLCCVWVVWFLFLCFFCFVCCCVGLFFLFCFVFVGGGGGGGGG